MFKKLIILFDKKNEQLIRQKYSSDLKTLTGKMAAHDVSVVWTFVEQDQEPNQEQKQGQNQAQNDVETKGEGNILAESLYLVDNSSNLNVLRLWGFYAVALIHEANRDAEFKGARYVIEGLEGLDYSYLNQVYQRLAGLPWDILETERLKVRESTVDDVEDFYRIYKEPSITYYMENLPHDMDEERAYINNYMRYVYGLYGFGMWTVILKETGSVIGRAGISIRDGYDIPELGFVIEIMHQGKGYAYEVCLAILKYADDELQMESVQALVCAGNAPSIKVLKRLGFSYCKDVHDKGKAYQLWMKNLSE